jgi:Thrombospondin type 3 repeat
MAVAIALISGTLTSRAVQNPTMSFDVDPAGNTYDSATNTMSVGAVDDCLTSPAPGNNALHTHTVHLVIHNVEDLIGWSVRLYWIGDEWRPLSAQFTPFTDGNTLQGVSYVNLPINSVTGLHNELSTATDFPSGAGSQWGHLGSSYLANPQTFAVSPDTPPKTVPDDNSYSAPNGGVLVSLRTQVTAGSAGKPSMFLNLDDGSPHPPGSGIGYFDGTGSQLILLPPNALGDAYHGEGITCEPGDCINFECPPGPDSDGDGVPNGSDNCPNWPNAAQNLPPWTIPANDGDCDGFSAAVEISAGTGPTTHCGTNAWPADIDNDTFVDVIGDISAVAGWFGNGVPPAPARYDIAPVPPDSFIDVIGDISRLTGLYNKKCV